MSTVLCRRELWREMGLAGWSVAADAATLAIAVGLELFGVVSRALGLNAEPAATRGEQCEHARGPAAHGIKISCSRA